jgi:hypothetical protein
MLMFDENGVPISKALPSLSGENAFGRLKAAKNDDAEIPVLYWDSLVWEWWIDDIDTLLQAKSFGSRYSQSPLMPICHFALAFWQTRIWKSFRRFTSNAYRHGEWHQPPIDTISREEWTRTITAEGLYQPLQWSQLVGLETGFTLLFWRWPSELFLWARDGLPKWLTSTPPEHRKLQPKEANGEI